MKPRQFWQHRILEDPGYVEVLEEEQDEFEGVLDDLLPSSSKMLLDFGCGSGAFEERLCELGGVYVGVDIHHGIINRPPPPHGVLLWMSEDRIPGRNQTYDLVVAIRVIQHIPSPQWEGLWGPELRRVMTEDSAIIVIDALPETDPQPHLFPRHPDEIADALQMPMIEYHRLTRHWAACFENVHASGPRG